MPIHTLIIAITAMLVAITATVSATNAPGTPVILTGSDLPHLIGAPVSSIRVLNLAGEAIPFQIDEVTESGEYVLDRGETPNAREGNGVFDKQDEIVFLWGDAQELSDESKYVSDAGFVKIASERRRTAARAVIIRSDPSLPLSSKSYISYDHAAQRVVTPFYYADFAKNRFHFVRAGVMDFGCGKYIDLTNELRVEILLRAMFGLVPIRYTEDNIVCFVRRYKAGPIRVIRRGDFHLNLGMGVKGSRAAVNQICYPQLVSVPVRINLPVRFRTLFSQAHVEMTPVIRESGRDFRFAVRRESMDIAIGGAAIDTVHPAVPSGGIFMVTRGNNGFGWLLNTTMPREHLGGSGYLLRRPPSGRAGIAECGFRLTVRDVPRGNYYITNWVVFSGGKRGDIDLLGQSVNLRIIVVK